MSKILLIKAKYLSVIGKKTRLICEASKNNKFYLQNLIKPHPKPILSFEKLKLNNDKQFFLVNSQG
jgi:hypothetical protein